MYLFSSCIRHYIYLVKVISVLVTVYLLYEFKNGKFWISSMYKNLIWISTTDEFKELT